MSKMHLQMVDLHKKKGRILVVHCSDPRFQAAYRKLIDNLGEYYDLLVFPGASKAVAEQQLVLDNIALLQRLHHFESIHIFDHIECGAFGKIDIDDEKSTHKAMLDKAKTHLKKVQPGVKVIGHLVGEKSEITL